MSYNLEFLLDHSRWPLDEIIKRSIREPGVCRELFRYVMPVHWWELVHERVYWLDGQLQPRQRAWATDLVGELNDGSIIHIEQQTSKRADMGIRMMEYGSQIAVSRGLTCAVRQIYFCTDCHRPFGYEHGAVIVNDQRSIRNSFQFFYAGDFNAWALLESPLFAVASMGLLSEHIDNLPCFVQKLADRAHREFNGSRLTDRLVSCVFMASLRRRAHIFVEAISVLEIEKVFEDPYLKEVLYPQGRNSAIALLDRKISQSTITLPNDFMIWLSRHDDVSFIEDVASSLGGALDFDDLTQMHDIDWPTQLTMSDPKGNKSYKDITLSARQSLNPPIS